MRRRKIRKMRRPPPFGGGLRFPCRGKSICESLPKPSVSGAFDRLSERACKPGSVIDSHLSRRTVAGAFQPPPWDGRAGHMSLRGVAPDRVYSIGHSRADGCALTAPFHPYLRYLHTSGGLFLLHFSSDRSGRALPVILALWSPDFPHAQPFGSCPRLSGLLARLFYTSCRTASSPAAIYFLVIGTNERYNLHV